MLVAVAGCIGSPGSSSILGTLRLPLSAPLQVDPIYGGPSASWGDSLIYSGLLQFDGSLNVVPDLAVALPNSSANGRTLTFSLRPHARFADGNPVTASDVAFSLERALAKHAHSAQAWRFLRDIKGAKAIHAGRTQILSGISVTGLHALTIELAQARSSFLFDLAMPPARVVDPSQVKTGGPWWRRGAGSGPFQIQHLGRRIALAANSRYFEGPAGIRSMILLRETNPEAYRSLYGRHALDATIVPAGGYAHASKSAQFMSTDSTTAFYAIANGLTPHRVRVALDESLNRSLLSAPGNPVDPAYALVPQVVQNYPAISDPRPYDPIPADKLLRRSAPVALAGTASQAPAAIYRWLALSWKKAGSGLAHSQPSPYQIRVVSVDIAVADPQLWLQDLGLAAFGGYDRRFQRMLNKANRVAVTNDPEAEWTYTNKAERYLLRRALVFPIGILKEGYLVSPKVHGLAPTPLGLEPSNENWASVSVG